MDKKEDLQNGFFLDTCFIMWHYENHKMVELNEFTYNHLVGITDFNIGRSICCEIPDVLIPSCADNLKCSIGIAAQP